MKKFPIPNYIFVEPTALQIKKGGTVFVVKIGTLLAHRDPSPLFSRGAAWVCIQIGNSKVLLAAANRSPSFARVDEDITDLLDIKNKSALSDDLNSKNQL